MKKPKKTKLTKSEIIEAIIGIGTLIIMLLDLIRHW